MYFAQTALTLSNAFDTKLILLEVVRAAVGA